MGMTLAAAPVARRPSDHIRYRPPAAWQQLTVRGLLADAERSKPDKHQLNFFERFASGELGDAPVFIAGNLSLLKQPSVSVVGTRQVSAEGAARARRIARDLALAGIVVVSGLAEGVDTAAMTSAIAQGGHVIGVIGTPLDKAFPAKNAVLQEEVYRKHLLVSQFRSGSQVFKSNFPKRNRLMAALSNATVVIEASDTSGTLHQAAECARLGRWLFIAKSVVDDPALTWPEKFLKHERCLPLEKIEDITSRILLPSS